MAVDPEQYAAHVQAEQIRKADEETRRQVEHFRQVAEDPEQQREWVRQNIVIYGALIAIGLVLIQPFLTATTLDPSAKICVIAFAAAIPLLGALVLVNHQESFRRRVSDSAAVRVTRVIAQMLAFAGVVAGFWHITWVAGVVILVSGFVAMLVHSAGFIQLEKPRRATTAPAEARSPDGAGEDGLTREPRTP